MPTFTDEEIRLRTLIDQVVPLGPGREAILMQLVRLVAAHQHEVRVKLEALAARRPEDQSRATAIRVLSEDPDGERILERAYRADPQQTGIELNYLGAERVRGALAVRAAIDDGAALQRPRA